MQTKEPPREYVPVGQETGSTAGEGHREPAGHTRHGVPAAVVYVAKLPYVVAQSVQLKAPARLYVPRGQAVTVVAVQDE